MGIYLGVAFGSPGYKGQFNFGIINRWPKFTLKWGAYRPRRFEIKGRLCSLLVSGRWGQPAAGKNKLIGGDVVTGFEKVRDLRFTILNSLRHHQTGSAVS